MQELKKHLQYMTEIPRIKLRIEGEITHCFKYLIQSARELKKGILAQPSQKKGKTMAQETIDLVHAFYMRMMNTVDSFPGKRIM